LREEKINKNLQSVNYLSNIIIIAANDLQKKI
jgi:hypothetical protein